jgi:hypothetical protein
MFLLFYYKDLPASSKHVLKEESAALRVLHSYKALKGSVFFDSTIVNGTALYLCETKTGVHFKAVSI